MKPWKIAPIVALAVVAIACSTPASGNVREGAGGPDAVQLMMHDDGFAPQELKLPAGREITVEVTNGGSNAHNFTIDPLDLSTGTMASGDVMTATFTVPEGATQFHCTFHPGMRGTILAT